MSPLTRTIMSASELVPNRALKAAIDSARGMAPQRLPGGTPLDPSFVPATVPAPALHLSITSMPADVVMGADGAGKSLVMSSVTSSADLERTPLDVVVCIDTSGSMGTAAVAEGIESSGLSMLDIVKHAVKTIIMTLGPNDRIGIVSYSNAARRVCELVIMNPAGRATAMTKLDTLEEDGMTNLWDGLKQSLDMLQQRTADHIDGVPSCSRSAAIYLLTDGVPNVDPPRGYVPSMQRYKDQNGGKYPAVINTFGFGYNLKSDLLLEMAQEGQGIYAFIPDSGFVGTVFVNALGNALSTMASQVRIAVSAEKADKALTSVSTYDIEAQTSPDAVNYVGRTIQVGQPFGALTLINDADLPLVMTTVQYNPNTASEAKTVSSTGPTAAATEAERQEIASEFFRVEAINCAGKCITLANSGAYSATGREIDRVVALINRWLGATTAVGSVSVPGETSPLTNPRSRVEALKADLDGQIREACSKEEYFKKWGLHFLRSIMRAHQLKQCNNFKDPGVQSYGNVLFQTVRDEADDRFTDLPPPTPKRVVQAQSYVRSSTASYASAAPAAPASMASYNDRSRGCFHERSMVSMAGGERKAAKHVRAGDVLRDGSVVKCVARTNCPDGKYQMIRLPALGEDQSLVITPYHPVQWQGKWQFPISIGEWVQCPCDAVYSYLVESADGSGTYAASALVDGVPTSMLAHEVRGVECLSHAFFGTSKVVDALKACPGFEAGLVVFSDGGYFLRDAGTQDVCGIDASFAVAY
jgi:Mg-chelatase subunit ChlD